MRWRDVATEHDRQRIRGWRTAWLEALQSARAGGHGAELEAEGALLEPDSAELDPTPPAGTYACRTLKIGARGDGMLSYVAYPPFRCRIGRDAAGRLVFTKLTGSQRPIGRLYADNERRLVFLGSLQLGDERESLRYGTDPERDLPGVLERIGPQRWRLVFPRPAFESIIDVIELVPER